MQDALFGQSSMMLPKPVNQAVSIPNLGKKDKPKSKSQLRKEYARQKQEMRLQTLEDIMKNSDQEMRFLYGLKLEGYELQPALVLDRNFN